MSWIFYAVAGHIMNAIAFIIDKTLLGSAFKQSATYAILISLLSSVVLVGTPWVTHWPGSGLRLYVIAFGALQTLALWAFFQALKTGEASRVVPIVGVLVAIFTFFGSSVTIGESFSTEQYIGFALLVISTGILAWGGEEGKGKMNMTCLCTAIVAAALFAISSVSGKFAFEHSSFFGVFVASRFYMFLAGFLLFFFHTPARKELFTLVFPQKRKEESVGTRAVFLTIGAQTSGAVGFILVNYAIALGSASLVNAMQAVQYGLIVLVAWFGGEYLETLLDEEKTPLIVTLKSIAIAFVAVGLFLISESNLL